MVFSTLEASISCMIKSFGMRRVQISSSKLPMLDYMCGEHVVNTLTKSKKWSKKVKLPAKATFPPIFSFLVNAC